MPREKIVGLLRPYFDLLPDDTAALQWLESHRRQFTWNAARKEHEVEAR